MHYDYYRRNFYDRWVCLRAGSLLMISGEVQGPPKIQGPPEIPPPSSTRTAHGKKERNGGREGVLFKDLLPLAMPSTRQREDSGETGANNGNQEQLT